MSSITEGMYKAQLLTETRTYKLWESAGQKIVEAQLTADQINQLFANIEQGATAAGGNRTMIGKGKDVATAVNKAWEDLKTKASNSGPIKNMDAMYDQAAEKLKQATGGDQGVMKYVQKYRDFAKKHPVAQSLIYGALIAAAGITGAGVGGAAALGLFKMVDKLLQGEKFSSAAYQGAKTGALAYGASKLGDLVTGRNTPVTAKSSKTTWDAVDQGFAKPQGAGGGLSGGGTTSGSDTWSATLRGVTGDQIRNHPDYATYIQRYGDTVNGRRMAQMAVKNAMARAQSNESIELNEATIATLFTRIDEGLWDTIKGKAQQIGKNLTTKVTADKLMKMWKAEGSPTDSNQLMFFLTQKAGVDKAVADKVFADMKIKTKTAKPAANKGLQSKPGINPATGKPFAPKIAAQPAAPAAGAKSSVPQGGGRVKGAGLSQTPNAIKKRQQRMTAKTTAQPKPAAATAAKPAANTAAAKPTAQPASTGSGLNYYNTVRNMRRRGMAVGEDQGSEEFQHKISNIVRQNPKGSASEKMILNRFLATPMVQDFNLKGQEWIDQAHEWLQTVKKDLQKKYPDADLSDLEELAHKMYEDYLARIGELEEGYSAGAAGGAGLGEEQAPMFTPEDKMVNANDPRSNGWRLYKAVPSGIMEGIIKENLLKTYGDQFGLDEDVYTDSLYKEFLDSDYNKNQGSYIDSLRNLGQFIRSKGMPEEKAKPIIRKLVAKLHPSGLNEEQMLLAELKCWQGYTRVRGVPAGAPGSCKKKTKESSIMKGIQSEEQVDEYKEIEGQRKIEFSKENPPDLYYLYQQFIQRMLNPENTIDPKDWIEKVNNHYGLNYSWKDYQKRGHNDHTDNWQKIINKYILKK